MSEAENWRGRKRAGKELNYSMPIIPNHHYRLLTYTLPEECGINLINVTIK